MQVLEYHEPTGKVRVSIRVVEGSVAAIDIARALRHKVPGAQLRNWKRDVVELGDMPPVQHAATDTLGRARRINFIPVPAVKFVLAKSRMQEPAKRLAAYFKDHLEGFDAPVIATSYQSKYIDALRQAFGDDLVTEHPVRGYSVDAYFPRANFGVEIDEHGHAQYDRVKDAKRTAAIPFELVRINPDVTNVYKMVAAVAVKLAKE